MYKVIPPPLPPQPACVLPDVEPLYQDVNTAELLPEPCDGATPRPFAQAESEDTSPSSPSAIPLWCELPEVIESGVLDTLTCTPPCDGATPSPCAHAQAESENTSPSSPSTIPLWCELPEVIESGVLDTLTCTPPCDGATIQALCTCSGRV